MNHGDEKRNPHPLDSQEDEEEHHAHAPGLPSYQEATSELRQPPPAYLAPNSTHTPGANNSTTAFLDEKRRAHHDAPTSSSSSSQSEPLKYIITVQNAALQQQKRILVQPAPGTGDPNPNRWDNDASDVRWEANYTTKYAATMLHREGGLRRGGPEPSSWNVAELKYPEFIWPGWCGVDITFLLNAVDGTCRGAPGKRFMHCTGVMTTKYAVDLPVMEGRRYVWQKTHRGLEDGNGSGHGGQGMGGDEKERLQRYYSALEKGGGDGGNQAAATATTTTATPQNPSVSSTSSPHGSAAGAALDLSAIFSNSWTPFTPLYLVDAESESHVLAQYTRSAPWASERGILEVFPHRRGNAEPQQIGEAAFVEGVVIACAAMVGMQDRLGLVSSLVEAGAEGYYAGKGKGRA
ncbi:hypothetical protein PG985_000152 [Apiospora marii]|uniref:uncharacterized protein n=1 Tax=Apiospora marii TaxID=335849 RepID=UPI003131911A